MSSDMSLLAAFLLAWIIWQVRSYYVGARRSSSALYNIRGPPPHSYLFGNLKRYFSRDGADFQRHVATAYGAVCRLNGLFCRPIIYVADPKALHTMLIKDDHIFQETEELMRVSGIVFGDESLISTLGARHSKQRKMLNPVFSANHMRHLLPVFYDITHKLRDAIASRVNDSPREIDMMAWMGRVALELVGQGGVGYSFDPLLQDGSDEYGQALKDLVPALTTLMPLAALLPITERLGPRWFWRAVLECFPAGTRINTVMKTVDTMDQKSREIYNARKRALEKGDVHITAGGKDILSTLLRANSTADASERLDEDEIVHQLSVLIFAAMDTTSNTLSRILHLLAIHQDVQERLSHELSGARAAEGVSYEDLNQLPLLDSICRETLRLYPPVTGILRTANEATTLPLLEPICCSDGQKISFIPVPKGAQFIVGFEGCNLNKSLWGEDALEWKPERWLSPLPSTVTDAHIPGVYSHLTSFLAGKRACIGFKFSELEMKVVLAVIISTFSFELPKRPLKWNVGLVCYPTVGESTISEMPLKVSLRMTSL